MAYAQMPAISSKMVGQPDNLNSLYTPDEIKAMLDLPPEEVRVFLNSFITLLGSTSLDNWLYQQIVSAVLSGVADNSLTDVKLSDAVGQIKERFTTYISEPITDVKLSDVAGQIKSRVSDLESNGNLVGEINVTDANTTSVVFSGLDGDAQGGYFISCEIIQNSVANPIYSLYVENDQVVGNYAWTNQLGGTNSDGARIGLSYQNKSANFGVDINKNNNGFFSVTSNIVIMNASDAQANQVYAVSKKAIIANITRLDIVSNTANGIGVGSRFRLYKRKTR